MQKTEVVGIYKASEGVLVNKDNDSLRKYRERRNLLKAKDEKINILEDRVTNLSKDMEEIKSLLKQLVK
jgi:hypothetical protein